MAALTREEERHGRRVFLQVLKDDEAAVAFYDRLGFKKVRTTFLTQWQVTGQSPYARGL